MRLWQNSVPVVVGLGLHFLASFKLGLLSAPRPPSLRLQSHQWGISLPSNPFMLRTSLSLLMVDLIKLGIPR